MIPQAYITEWATKVPWQTNEQVEQDLVICRALVEIFSDEWLASSLAFRGGTALHKLFLSPQPRYSEDIDLVQLRAEPIKETVSKLQKTLQFLGECTVKRNVINTTLRYRFDSEFPPSQRRRWQFANSPIRLSCHGGSGFLWALLAEGRHANATSRECLLPGLQRCEEG